MNQYKNNHLEDPLGLGDNNLKHEHNLTLNDLRNNQKNGESHPRFKILNSSAKLYCIQIFGEPFELKIFI